MDNETIYFTTPKGEYSIPNSWELLTPEQYLFLCALIAQFAAEKATQHDVQLHYVCKILKINIKKITDADAMANLIILADKIDFIFGKDGKVNICFLAQLVPKVRLSKKLRVSSYDINTEFSTLTCSLTASQFIDAQEVLKSNASTPLSNQLPLLAGILYSKPRIFVF
jgi:hypothetical protein